MDFLASLPNWTKIIVDIARQSGAILKRYWGNLSLIEEKKFSGDLVTEADRKSEQLIIEALKGFFPSHSILAEESAVPLSEFKADFLWVVDPLDGTTNYTHQYPLVAISIGLLYQGEPVLGVIYNPILEELYVGAKGLGATLNDKPIAVSQVDSLQKSLLGTGFAYDRRQTPG